MANDYWKTKFQNLNDEQFREVEEAIVEVSAGTDVEEPKDDIIHISEYTDEIEEDYKHWGEPIGLMTGYENFDKKVGGFGGGHVILIGGETSNGKSAFAANIAVNIAARNERVLYISLEMTAKEIMLRFRHMHDAPIGDLNLEIQKTHDVEYQHINGIIQRSVDANENGPLELVIIDYMQYLGRGMTNQEVAKMSKMFKQLALKFDIPMIVIVSLRKSEGGKSKRKWTDISVEDFMGTGAIGYDCDTAWIVSRKNMEDDYIADRVFIKLLKTRNAKLDYDKQFMSFKWEATRISEDLFSGDIPKEDEDGFIEAKSQNRV